MAGRLIALVLVLVSVPASGEEKRVYHPVAVADMPTTLHTHVQVEGVVTYVAREADGDVHFRLEDGGAFIVCEVVPWHPMRRVRIGQRVRVFGLTREDKKHHWFEVHPIEDVRLVAPAP